MSANVDEMIVSAANCLRYSYISCLPLKSKFTCTCKGNRML